MRTFAYHISSARYYFGLFFFSALMYSCTQAPQDTLFTALPSSQTGIDFENPNVDTDTLSIIDYLNYYNGAGVAVADINNDGLPDIYFASNTAGNKLYLNKGNLTFEDITRFAGVAGKADWTTGVTMADVNGDGYLDIYVSTVAHHDPHLKNVPPHIYFKHSRNQLFINNHNNTFTESAAKWGIDLEGYNTQAVFFDYDKDGDLDLFQLQHSTHQPDTYGPASLRNKYSEVSGGKLFRNDGDYFTNVTKEAGIISCALGYGLGVAVADVNHDGYDDIYVSNDFHENDYYYINQGNGTFREINNEAFGHESKSSMGNDIADINNDGWPDIITVDMLPEDEKILKSSLTDDAIDTYTYQRKLGYSNQYVRNCLQLNIGKGMKFADIALYSGVSTTDWSWSPLIADFNLDGRADIFISNGVKKRPNDLDYLKFISALPKNEPGMDARAHDRGILQHLPDGKWHNYIFEGEDDFKFKDQSAGWGFEQANLSQGAIYADLDGDGDLDIITNNINTPAGIYKNNSREKFPGNHYVTIALKGKAPNTFALGSKVFLFHNNRVLYKELQPVKGFMSSGEPVLNIGLGKDPAIDSAVIIWPDNTVQTVRKIEADKTIIISYKHDATDTIVNQQGFINHLLHTTDAPVFTNASQLLINNFTHEEDPYSDFYNEWYIPHELSTQGPKIAVADVNKDGLQDYFICGAKNQPGVIFLQQKDGSFKPAADSATFVADKAREDVNAVFFDADNDGDQDLYVVSGGNVYTGITPLLHDRLYLNDGKGNFSFSDAIPAMDENKSAVCVADIDHDGDLDIFIGGRSFSRNYSKIPASYLLINNGKGQFSFAEAGITGTLQKLGMVTDACFTDIDKDGWDDLIITGEWMSPVLFKNNHGKLARAALTSSDDNLKGWWFSVKAADINGDGFEDILLGNYGLNSKLTASIAYPFKMYSVDLTRVGHDNQILALAKNNKYYPFLTKEDLENQMPYLKKEFLQYSNMAGKTVEEIFGKKLDDATVFTTTTFASIALVNDGKGQYTAMTLPATAQWSPIFAFAAADFNGDGKTDLITGGNFYGTRPYEGRYDAMALLLLTGDGKGHFQPVLPLPEALCTIGGEIRSIQPIKLSGNKRGLLIGINNHQPVLVQY
ncbi:MAG: VCBS repeat-containing protein [Chitinophagaceae bacterium]|nr:VCBS repeat-containing protein [Chitinophagaceae bacterium]